MIEGVETVVRPIAGGAGTALERIMSARPTPTGRTGDILAQYLIGTRESRPRRVSFDEGFGGGDFRVARR